MLRRSTGAVSDLVLRGNVCFLHQSSVNRFKEGRGTGKSSLFSNERRWKDDLTFHALGTIDELSSQIGKCRNYVLKEGLFDVCEVLTRVQSSLQDVGAHVATPPDASKSKLSEPPESSTRTKFDVSVYEFVNKHIDVYGDRVPPLREFILTGGNDASSELQCARSICRRAERCMVPLLREDVIDKNALRFINRYYTPLSDLLFVLGRFTCYTTGTRESRYQKFHEFDPLKTYYQF
ncbi:unnamed protein product [Enterobius vermicularis]|uniref:Corrinoid adenosyltransferase MMAB n=1 Tax=Enterobius vermicularis TaxID=51028 RepID=A0A0N4V5R5_ENTVE|nr:unnamed protein product [Enterobius vermicularis]